MDIGGIEAFGHRTVCMWSYLDTEILLTHGFRGKAMHMDVYKDGFSTLDDATLLPKVKSPQTEYS